MDAISKWINNGSLYDDGVSLYKTLPSHNKLLLKNFQKKQSSQLHEKLKYELQKYAKQVVSTVKKQTENAFVESNEKPIGQNLTKSSVAQHIAQNFEIETKKHALYFHELPSELRPVLLQANSLFKEMCLLKVALNELPAEAETKANDIQIKIAEKQIQNANCWSKIDYWQEHKTAPKKAENKFDKMAPAQLVKQEQYLFASISKLSARCKENRQKMKSATTLQESNKLQRAIAKQESNIIKKNEELINLKQLIYGNN